VGIPSARFLNLSSEDLSRRVYRIVPAERLFQLFETGKNVLVNPKKWEDPFENVVLKSIFPRLGLYGQCWTRHTASDAMWRIYSPRIGGIRIRTTVQALFNSLLKATPRTGARPFIGTVEYLSDQRLIRFARTAVAEANWEAAECARTLLVKRRAFQHEREVRLIAVEVGEHRGRELLTYDTNPHVVINQMMLDPRLTEAEADRLRDKIFRRTGFKGSILRSLLYTLPQELSRIAETSSRPN
jgi:hypothetical protein